jgi:hypothetical protein
MGENIRAMEEKTREICSWIENYKNLSPQSTQRMQVKAQVEAEAKQGKEEPLLLPLILTSA